ncbi:MAG: hypothetical protein HKM89_00405 [Gemmatimonadales bacterium]|nr:hypothetical protein [Gemmatimonadales bacterium]
MKRILLLLLPFLLAATPTMVAAQGSPPLVKYGKWAVLAASVGLNLLAADAHTDANRAFDLIEARCETPHNARCEVDGAGTYVDPVTEGLFQETLRLDDRAERWLIAGEAALLGATALFIWELTRSQDSPPENEPFAPIVQEFSHGIGLGFEVRF